MNQTELRRYLNVIKRAVSFIEGMLDNDDGGLLESLSGIAQPQLPQPVAAPVPQPAPAPVQVSQPVVAQPNNAEAMAFKAARQKHIGDLMAIDCWPEAVPQFLVAKDASAEDQANRANAVLDMLLDRRVEGLTFLDFGCGDGWIAGEVLKRGVTESVGYDVKESSIWPTIKGPKFTSNFNDLQPGYYDVIFLYDVLDHCEDPVFLMSQIQNLIKPTGTVYVRCHPWTSKHATHLYKQGINKAYLHLFLTYEEIKELINQDPVFTRAEKKPLEAYHWWFNNFTIKKERSVKEPVNGFFHVPSFKELLANEQQIPMNEIDNFVNGLDVQFVDFCLVPKK
jgi:2-polyprenyl-3-methyl-5-hydroxy-6-metoxy-1,4-benzoquinol methylase